MGYINTTDKLHLIVVMTSEYHESISIWRYTFTEDAAKNKWTRQKHLDMRHGFIGYIKCCKTVNEKYLIIMGGDETKEENHKKVLILNLHQMQWHNVYLDLKFGNESIKTDIIYSLVALDNNEIHVIFREDDKYHYKFDIGDCLLN